MRVSVYELKSIVAEAVSKLPSQAQLVTKGLVIPVPKQGLFLMTKEPEQVKYQLTKAGKRFSPMGSAIASHEMTFQQNWIYSAPGRSIRFVTGKPIKAKGDPNDYNHEHKHEVYVYEVQLSLRLRGREAALLRWDDTIRYMDARDLRLLKLGVVARERTVTLPLVVGSRADGSIDYADFECVVKDGIVVSTKDGDPVWRFDVDTLELAYQPSFLEVREKEHLYARLSDIESGNV